MDSSHLALKVLVNKVGTIIIIIIRHKVPRRVPTHTPNFGDLTLKEPSTKCPEVQANPVKTNKTCKNFSKSNTSFTISHPFSNPAHSLTANLNRHRPNNFRNQTDGDCRARITPPTLIDGRPWYRPPFPVSPRLLRPKTPTPKFFPSSIDLSYHLEILPPFSTFHPLPFSSVIILPHSMPCACFPSSSRRISETLETTSDPPNAVTAECRQQ
ncbi:hypothetical protein R3P38DRAFT_969540 [Favolaschia claudopus]|uniref:Uncharacterized protein n=1 Tax=Favolaschia claudopus TaxID=2862362 RepID=A0AAW0E935_9AGAR